MINIHEKHLKWLQETGDKMLLNPEDLLEQILTRVRLMYKHESNNRERGKLEKETVIQYLDKFVKTYKKVMWL